MHTHRSRGCARLLACLLALRATVGTTREQCFYNVVKKRVIESTLHSFIYTAVHPYMRTYRRADLRNYVPTYVGTYVRERRTYVRA